MAIANTMRDPTKANFTVIRKSIAIASIVMIITEFQRVRSLTFSNKLEEGTLSASAFTAVKIIFSRRRLIAGPIKVMTTIAAKDILIQATPQPHVEKTKYKPGSKIKITLNGSNPSIFHC